jgi:hypothetical protein
LSHSELSIPTHLLWQLTPPTFLQLWLTKIPKNLL